MRDPYPDNFHISIVKSTEYEKYRAEGRRSIQLTKTFVLIGIPKTKYLHRRLSSIVPTVMQNVRHAKKKSNGKYLSIDW